MFSTYRKALALLSRKEKRRGGLVPGVAILMPAALVNYSGAAE